MLNFMMWPYLACCSIFVSGTLSRNSIFLILQMFWHTDEWTKWHILRQHTVKEDAMEPTVFKYSIRSTISNMQHFYKRSNLSDSNFFTNLKPSLKAYHSLSIYYPSEFNTFLSKPFQYNPFWLFPIQFFLK